MKTILIALMLISSNVIAKEKTMNKKVREIIVYQIRPEAKDEFLKIKQQMIKESYTLEGLHSSTTSKSVDSDNVYIDIMVWDSKEASKKALPVFEKLPTAASFLGTMAGPPLYHHYMEFEDDNLK